VSTIIGTVKVSGFTGRRFGHVIAGIDIGSHDEARLLEEIIHTALRDRAGHPAEATLARWSNSIAETRRRAVREEWTGWTPTPTT
jgi:hypothetical protein